MKACVIESPGKVSILEVPEPTPNEYQALVKILACATCNSTDLKLIEGKMRTSYPCILGHESVGEVLSVGAMVRSFSVGDIVTRPCAVYPNELLGE
ncbi:MAG TPA: sorbitol dehydrogenase, partial [Armatimonadetes bacterium]|nr:sorbitol dehydrogenase [Armatimonadota bacterium]